MIDVILFLLGFAAMRLSVPLGVALLFASFHVPGWFIASGNLAAAVLVLALAVAELVLRVSTPEPGELLASRVGLRGVARAAIPLAMGVVIYLTGIGRPRGAELLEGPIEDAPLLRQIEAAYGAAFAALTMFFGLSVWLGGSISMIIYGGYLGFGYLRSRLDALRELRRAAAAAQAQRQEPTEPMRATEPALAMQGVPTAVPVVPEPSAITGLDAIIDGSNMAHLGDPVPTLARVAVVVRRLAEMGLRWLVVFDASLKHRLPEGELPAEHVQVLTGVGLPMTEQEALRRMMESRRAYEVPAGTSADRFILRMARRWNAIVVSNDTFSDHLEEFPEAQQRRVTCMLVAGEVFFEPDPVEALRRIREAGGVRGEGPPGYVG